MKYWYGFWAVCFGVGTVILAILGVISLVAFNSQESGQISDMAIMGLAAFGLLVGVAWVFLSASISCSGLCLGREDLIKMGDSMLPL